MSALTLATMTIEEKIQTMENLWDDLCSKANSLASPSWHKQLLSQREADVKQGIDDFVDWDTAKEQIKKQIKK